MFTRVGGGKVKATDQCHGLMPIPSKTIWEADTARDRGTHLCQTSDREIS